MTDMVRVLIFEDNPDQLHLLRRNIEGEDVKSWWLIICTRLKTI